MTADNQLVCYEFGDWFFEPHLNQLRRANEVRHLEYRAIEVLRYLLEHPGQIVSVTDLLAAVWADRVVEPNVIHRNLSLIRQALGDDPRTPTYIETISKRGYRTIAAVEAKVVTANQPEASDLSFEQTAAPQAGWKGRFVFLLACIALAVLAFVWLPQNQKPEVPPALGNLPSGSALVGALAPRPNSVAVLPFTNLSPHFDDAYFAAGVHQEIIDRLVTSSDLLVIARGSAVAYAQQGKSIQEVATELGVAAVLTGSVRFEKNRVRLAVQLVDGQSALHLWSQTFERDLIDIFGIQDDIAVNIAQQLNATLAEGGNGKVLRNPQAYLLHLQARHLLNLGGLDHDRLQRAEVLLEQALEIAPRDSVVILELARLYLQKEQSGMVPYGSTAQARRDMIEMALELEPNNGVAHAWLGWHAMFSLGDMAMSAQRYQVAMALAPNNANVTRGLTSLLLHVGKVPQAHVLAKKTVALDPLCAICLNNLAASQLQLADYDGAIASARSALSLQPDQFQASMTLGIAQLLAGDPTSASITFDALPLPYYRTALLAMAQYELGQQEEFLQTRALLLQKWPQASLLIGTVYAFTGASELAFTYLDAAAQEGIDQQRVGYHGGPHDVLLTKLKQDPRWLAYLKKSGQGPNDLAEFDFQFNP